MYKILVKIFEKIGTKVKIDIFYYIRNGFWMTVNQVVNMIILFFSSIVLARYLSKEIYGQYQLMLAIMSMMAIFSLPGLNTAVARAVAKGFDKSYLAAVRTSVKYSFFSLPVFIIISIWYFWNADYIFAIVMLCAALFFYQIFGLNTWVAYLNGKARFKEYAKLNSLQTLITNSLLITAAMIVQNNLLIIVLVYLVFNSFFNTIVHFYVKKKLSDTAEDPECIEYGKFMTKSVLLSVLLENIDKIIVGFFDIETLAVYSIAVKLKDIIKSFVKDFFAITFPKFAQQKRRITGLHIFLLMLLGLFCSTILFFISKPIIIYFYTEQYTEAAIIFERIIFVLPFIFVVPLLMNKALAQASRDTIIYIRILVPIFTLTISLIVFWLTKSSLYFLITKIYVFQIANFLVLVRPSLIPVVEN